MLYLASQYHHALPITYKPAVAASAIKFLLVNGEFTSRNLIARRH